MAEFPSIGMARHRIGTDGMGVTTLVACAGCPLRCAYCLNPRSWRGAKITYTPESLYEAVRQDELYFAATGGGVTFGGGEPLLFARFITDFRNICGNWAINVETSLNVEREKVKLALDAGARLIIDIKDMNPEIYARYTSYDNARVRANLRMIGEISLTERATIRVPLIPGYNTDWDRRESVDELKRMGFTRFDLFEYVRRASDEESERA